MPQADSTISLLSYHSTKLEFPFVEYRPLRSFSQDQTSDIKLQFAFGVDLPYKIKTLQINKSGNVKLNPVWSITMRVLFNYRHYF